MDQRKLMDNANTITDMAKVSNKDNRENKLHKPDKKLRQGKIKMTLYKWLRKPV